MAGFDAVPPMSAKLLPAGSLLCQLTTMDLRHGSDAKALHDAGAKDGDAQDSLNNLTEVPTLRFRRCEGCTPLPWRYQWPYDPADGHEPWCIQRDVRQQSGVTLGATNGCLEQRSGTSLEPQLAVCYSS